MSKRRRRRRRHRARSHKVTGLLMLVVIAAILPFIRMPVALARGNLSSYSLVSDSQLFFNRLVGTTITVNQGSLFLSSTLGDGILDELIGLPHSANKEWALLITFLRATIRIVAPAANESASAGSPRLEILLQGVSISVYEASNGDDWLDSRAVGHLAFDRLGVFFSPSPSNASVAYSASAELNPYEAVFLALQKTLSSGGPFG